MTDIYGGLRNWKQEAAGGGQGEIKISRLTPEELAELDQKYPKPTGKAAEKPFVIKGTV